MLKSIAAGLVAGLAFAAPAFSADAPAEIKIGTLYASSGRYASISMPVHYGLKLWADQKNAAIAAAHTSTTARMKQTWSSRRCRYSPHDRMTSRPI